jgi:hypothetical protein
VFSLTGVNPYQTIKEPGKLSLDIPKLPKFIDTKLPRINEYPLKRESTMERFEKAFEMLSRPYRKEYKCLPKGPKNISRY